MSRIFADAESLLSGWCRLPIFTAFFFSFLQIKATFFLATGSSFYTKGEFLGNFIFICGFQSRAASSRVNITCDQAVLLLFSLRVREDFLRIITWLTLLAILLMYDLLFLWP